MSSYDPLRVAVIGCGGISGPYGASMRTKPEKVEIVGAYDMDAERAEAWAKEFAPWGITVNAVAPGYIDTPMMDGLLDDAGKAAHVAARIPLGRMGVAADLTAAIAFLVSEEAGFITGQTISPNGGNTIVGI